MTDAPARTTLTGDELVDLLAGPLAGRPDVGSVMIVDGVPTGRRDELARAGARLATLPWLVLARHGWDGAAAGALGLVDAIVDDPDDLAAIDETVDRAPIASVALALHLRSRWPSIADGLVSESTLYSALQAGPEFARWRAETPRRTDRVPGGPAVRIERTGDELHIELTRPEVRNALSAQLRDELLEALAVAEADEALHVTLTGQGPSFCSGGDLDEFGTFADPASAHLLRVERSIGAVLARLADRLTVRMQGACAGSGIELPAFAGTVIADPGTTFRLPELALGLVPGAGGTVSLPARIGRHATAHLALTGTPIDAPTALRTGLIDEVAEVPAPPA
ncbi:enoyl-CoA hydratase/isomerase family protein [Aquihabitans sp. McL0605]|uniref:enoyl-CoA hydratase/isomerase family protein n=1 Tax=Aquihabitans sp. McL0605 TaxID=3415671 RepID=UPI003CF8DBCF